MLPVEHTLYAHLCFLRVAARRTNARRSEPERAERARSRLPDALLWSLKFAENLSFRSASVVSHTSLPAFCLPSS